MRQFPSRKRQLPISQRYKSHGKDQRDIMRKCDRLLRKWKLNPPGMRLWLKGKKGGYGLQELKRCIEMGIEYHPPHKPKPVLEPELLLERYVCLSQGACGWVVQVVGVLFDPSSGETHTEIVERSVDAHRDRALALAEMFERAGEYGVEVRI